MGLGVGGNSGGSALVDDTSRGDGGREAWVRVRVRARVRVGVGG